MTKANAVTALKELEPTLPYGAKTKIARQLRKNKHNIQTAFRGMAGEKLTIKVLEKAQKLYPELQKPVKRKHKRAKTKSKL